MGNAESAEPHAPAESLSRSIDHGASLRRDAGSAAVNPSLVPGPGSGVGGDGGPEASPTQELLAEIAEGLEGLSDQELAAWVCRANNLLDASMVQRARRTFKLRLRSEKPT
jgi:hypothetical protein